MLVSAGKDVGIELATKESAVAVAVVNTVDTSSVMELVSKLPFSSAFAIASSE